MVSPFPEFLSLLRNHLRCFFGRVCFDDGTNVDTTTFSAAGGGGAGGAVAAAAAGGAGLTLASTLVWVCMGCVLPLLDFCIPVLVLDEFSAVVQTKHYILQLRRPRLRDGTHRSYPRHRLDPALTHHLGGRMVMKESLQSLMSVA